VRNIFRASSDRFRILVQHFIDKLRANEPLTRSVDIVSGGLGSFSDVVAVFQSPNTKPLGTVRNGRDSTKMRWKGRPRIAQRGTEACRGEKDDADGLQILARSEY